MFSNNSYYKESTFSKREFYEYYKDEIDELFNNMICKLRNGDIQIHSYDKFYNDFINYAYKYSIINKPRRE